MIPRHSDALIIKFGLLMGATCSTIFNLSCAASQQETPVVRWGGGTSPNMVSSAKNLPGDPAAATPLWELNIGTHQYSIPTIDRGRIFVTTQAKHGKKEKDSGGNGRG